LVAAAALTLQGCLGGEKSGDVSWRGEPRIFTPPTLPDDRILSGSIANDSLRTIRLSANELRLFDERGRRIDASVTFLRSVVHGLYPPAGAPRLPDAELRRTGRIAVIAPGKSVPLTVSWQQPPDAPGPARVDYPSGSLAVPSTPGSGGS
jgi:hypothetical protein